MAKFNKDNHEGDIKEEFCGACFAIPAAIIGAGAAGVGAKRGSHDKMKKILFWGGITVTVVSAVIAIIYLTKCTNCR